MTNVIRLCLTVSLLLITQLQTSAQRVDKCIVDASISTNLGFERWVGCAIDQLPDNLTFDIDRKAMPFAFLLTDGQNVIIEVSLNNSFDFSNLPQGTYRVYGFTFKGQIIATVGANALDDKLASVCYGLTMNFIEIITAAPKGGQINLMNDASAIFSCEATNNTSNFQLATTSTDQDYLYLIIDEANTIIDTFSTIIYPTSLPTGNYRISGASLAGTPIFELGTSKLSSPLTNACWDLSDNLIALVRQPLDAGNISTTNNEESVNLCLANPTSSIVFTKENIEDPYALLLIDPNSGQLLDFATELTITANQLTNLPPTIDKINVVGLAYSGNLLLDALIGETIENEQLASRCFSISENGIELFIDRVEGGSLQFDTGVITENFCATNSNPTIRPIAQGTIQNPNYFYVITDLEETILGVYNSETFSPLSYNQETLYIWGVASIDPIDFEVGSQLTSAVTDARCADRSENALQLNNIQLAAGTLSFAGNTERLFLCNPTASIIDISLENASGGVNFLLVRDTAGQIMDAQKDFQISLENLSCSEVRCSYLLSNLTYNGLLSDDAVIDVLIAGEIPEGCSIESNPIELQISKISAGELTTVEGSSSVNLCSGNLANTIPLLLQNQTQAPYLQDHIVITNSEDTIIGIQQSLSIDIAAFEASTLKIWGVTSEGSLSFDIGTPIAAIHTNTCQAITSEPVIIERAALDGGTITISDEQPTDIIACSNRTNLLFIPTSQTAAAYGIILTDTSGIVLDFQSSINYVFGDIESGLFQFWGVSFSGELNEAIIGQPLRSVPISTGCWELSENQITIRNSTLSAGEPKLENGENQLILCNEEVAFLNLNLSRVDAIYTNYLFFITDEFGFVRDTFSNSNFTGFLNDGERIYGLSYTGQLQLRDLFFNFASIFNDPPFSDGCFELSKRFIEISAADAVGGSINVQNITQNSTSEASISAKSGDFLFLTSNSTNPAYDYFITDTLGTIVELLTANPFRLTLGNGKYQLRGLAYVGSFDREVAGMNLTELSEKLDCFEFSENAIQLTVEDGLVAYPNPAFGQLTIGWQENDEQLVDSKATILVLSNQGEQLIREQVSLQGGQNLLELDISRLQAGSFYLVLQTAKGVKRHQFMVVNP